MSSPSLPVFDSHRFPAPLLGLTLSPVGERLRDAIARTVAAPPRRADGSRDGARGPGPTTLRGRLEFDYGAGQPTLLLWAPLRIEEVDVLTLVHALQRELCVHEVTAVSVDEAGSSPFFLVGGHLLRSADRDGMTLALRRGLAEHPDAEELGEEVAEWAEEPWASASEPGSLRVHLCFAPEDGA